nr:uncharacterized protein LOC109165304 [Ipomoea batatas]
MEEFKLVLEVFEGGSDGIEALSFMNRRRVIFLINSKLLHENEAGRLIVLPSGVLVGVGSRSLLRTVVEVQIVGLSRLVDGVQEVSSGDGMDGVAELIVQIPDFLQHGFDLFLFFDLHFPFHAPQTHVPFSLLMSGQVEQVCKDLFKNFEPTSEGEQVFMGNSSVSEARIKLVFEFDHVVMTHQREYLGMEYLRDELLVLDVAIIRAPPAFNSKERLRLKRSKGGEAVTLEACKKELRERAMVDVNKDTVDANKMLELFETFVNQVGKDKVVQVISDNASVNVRVGKDLMEAYPNLYWMSCAAHCINLMLKDIFEIRHFSMAYKRALKLSVYIHSKTKLLNRLRKYTGKCDLVKFAKTRFATAFLTFKRLHEQKNNLRKLFNSEEFLTSSYFKEEAGKECSRIVQMPNFWNTILEALKIGDPLISTLCSFEVLCADSIGLKVNLSRPPSSAQRQLQQTAGSESKTAPPPSAAGGGLNKSGEVPTPQAKRPQQQRRPCRNNPNSSFLFHTLVCLNRETWVSEDHLLLKQWHGPTSLSTQLDKQAPVLWPHHNCPRATSSKPLIRRIRSLVDRKDNTSRIIPSEESPAVELFRVLIPTDRKNGLWIDTAEGVLGDLKKRFREHVVARNMSYSISSKGLKVSSRAGNSLEQERDFSKPKKYVSGAARQYLVLYITLYLTITRPDNLFCYSAIVHFEIVLQTYHLQAAYRVLDPSRLHSQRPIPSSRTPNSIKGFSNQIGLLCPDTNAQSLVSRPDNRALLAAFPVQLMNAPLWSVRMKQLSDIQYSVVQLKRNQKSSNPQASASPISSSSVLLYRLVLDDEYTSNRCDATLNSLSLSTMLSGSYPPPLRRRNAWRFLYPLLNGTAAHFHFSKVLIDEKGGIDYDIRQIAFSAAHTQEHSVGPPFIYPRLACLTKPGHFVYAVEYAQYPTLITGPLTKLKVARSNGNSVLECACGEVLGSFLVVVIVLVHYRMLDKMKKEDQSEDRRFFVGL